METKTIIIGGAVIAVAYFAYKAYTTNLAYQQQILLQQTGNTNTLGNQLLTSGVNAAGNIVNGLLGTLESGIGSIFGNNSSGIYHPTETNSSTSSSTS